MLLPVAPRLAELAKFAEFVRLAGLATVAGFAVGKCPCNNQAWKSRGSFFILEI